MTFREFSDSFSLSALVMFSTHVYKDCTKKFEVSNLNTTWNQQTLILFYISILWIFIIIFKLFILFIPTQKMEFSIKDFFSKCGQIRRKLRIWSHLMMKSLMENFIFCAVIKMNQASSRFKNNFLAAIIFKFLLKKSTCWNF